MKHSNGRGHDEHAETEERGDASMDVRKQETSSHRKSDSTDLRNAIVEAEESSTSESGTNQSGNASSSSGEGSENG